MTAGNLVETAQMCKTRGTNFASVRSFASVTDQIDAHFPLRSLDGCVRVAGGHSVSLGEEKEVMDEGFHVLLHSCPRRWRDLVVFDFDRSSGHLVQALVDNAKRLSELLHAAQIAVVAVAILADGNVKLDLVVCVVGLTLPDIPGHARTAQHDTREGVIEGIRGRDHTNPLRPANPNTVVCQELFGFIDAITKLSGPRIDIVQETERNICLDTTRTNISSM